jgi:hypothetical protein
MATRPGRRSRAAHDLFQELQLPPMTKKRRTGGMGELAEPTRVPLDERRPNYQERHEPGGPLGEYANPLSTPRGR